MPETGRRTPSTNDVAGKWWDTGTGKTTRLPYAAMTLEDIAALDVASIAAVHSHLYLWTTNRFVEESYSIARAWGFRPRQLLTWAKPPMGIGFGGTFTSTSEFVLFCRRGTLTASRRHDSSWFGWQRPYINGHIAHSAKPEAFLDLVEQVSPGPYLEMFSRRARLGWDTWGDEALHGTALLGAAVAG
jgi:N6-adenosine-specific RNA methylase IME4